MATVVLVGAGPRGLGVLERLTADAGRGRDGSGGVARPPQQLDVHLVDPFPPGGGRVWRADQPDLLWLNSRAVDVTLYPDSSVVMAGVPRPGPTFWEWVAAGGGGGTGGQPSTADVDSSGHVDAGAFLPRTAFSAYLESVLDTVRAGLPPGVHLTVHADTVLDVRDAPADVPPPTGTRARARARTPSGTDGARTGRQEVVLASGETLTADAVVLCQGHAAVDTEPALRRFADAAATHGTTWIAPGYGADVDLSALGAGEAVLVRGLGLGFLDEVVALTEGRGGRYEPRAGGGLGYLPSGAEPRLYAGSRRGLPYHCKPVMELGAPRAVLPRHATRAAARSLHAAAGRPLDLREDLWPLVARDLAHAWYHELFLAHPERVHVDWPAFRHVLDRAGWDSAELVDAVVRAVPDPADRFDPVRLDRPAGGRDFDGLAGYGAWARAHLRADVDRRTTSANSPELALYWALLTMNATLTAIAAEGLLSARSRVHDLEGRYLSFLAAVASGPPPRRLEQLIALGDAGVLTLLGPHTCFDVDDHTGDFVGVSPAVGETVRARALLEARLPSPTVLRSRDPLLRALARRGEAAEEVVTDVGGSFSTGRLDTREADHRLLAADGTVHPRRFAVGPGPAGGAPAPDCHGPTWTAASSARTTPSRLRCSRSSARPQASPSRPRGTPGWPRPSRPRSSTPRSRSRRLSPTAARPDRHGVAGRPRTARRRRKRTPRTRPRR